MSVLIPNLFIFAQEPDIFNIMSSIIMPRGVAVKLTVCVCVCVCVSVLAVTAQRLQCDEN